MSEGLVVLYAFLGWTVVLMGGAVILRLRRGRPTARDIALEELEAHWAQGEMTRQEYDRRRHELLARPD
jgi:uncharacterized membrane protein